MKKALTFLSFFIVLGVNAQTANYWTKLNDWPALKRERAVSFVINGYAYVGTGIDTAEILHSDFWKYDASNDTWSQVADMPGDARRNAVAFAIGDNGYVGSGMNHEVAPLGQELSDFYQYNGTANSWTAKATIPGAGKYFGTGFAVGGKGYIACGKMGPNNYSSALVEYDPNTDSWASKAPFPGGVRYQLSSFVIDNLGYVGMGTDQDMYRKDFYAYNPANDTWTQIADLPASQRSASQTFTLGQRGFVCMGNNGSILDDLWEYNPFTDAWSVRANYGGSSRKNGIGFAINNRGYVGIGGGYSGKKQSWHMYTPYDVIGLGELRNEKLNVYPNPAVDVVNVNDEGKQIESLELYTLSGERLRKEPFAPAIEVIDLAKGTYVLIAKNAEGVIVASTKLNKQ